MKRKSSPTMLEVEYLRTLLRQAEDEADAAQGRADDLERKACEVLEALVEELESLGFEDAARIVAEARSHF